MSIASQAVSIARQQTGIMYYWGGASPKPGFDCSGLVDYAYFHAGLTSIGNGHSNDTHSLAIKGINVPFAALEPGDIVFPFANDEHVQIFSGNHMIIEAPHTGAVVREVPMWGFAHARRLVQSTGSRHTTYTVRAGDTLSGIALRFQTTVQRIATFNHLTNVNMIKVGQILVIVP